VSRVRQWSQTHSFVASVPCGAGDVRSHRRHCTLAVDVLPAATCRVAEPAVVSFAAAGAATGLTHGFMRRMPTLRLMTRGSLSSCSVKLRRGWHSMTL